MARQKSVLERLRKICLSFPESKETITWGEPHFRVREKIFAGYGEANGKPSIGFKLTMEHADVVVRTPRFERSKYVGRHGWVTMDASGIKDWAEVAAMVRESYTLIAPKRLVKQLRDNE